MINKCIEMKNNNLFLIAEIGINHNGDINLAKRLIDEAAKGDFDAVKFEASGSSAEEFFML